MASKNGDIWINNQTEKLRFKVNDKNRTVSSAPWYKAGEAFAIGVPLGINTSGKVVKLTTATTSINDASNLKSVGIANNASAGVDSDVEVLTSSKVTLAWSLLDTTAIDTIDAANDIGKAVFASSTPGKYTLSRESAVLGGKNVVELGVLVDYVLNTSFTIDIQLSGDGRGPIGISHVEYPLAEPYFIRNQSGPLPPKVFAVGTDTVGSLLDYTLYLKNSAVGSLADQWFVIYNGYWAYGYYFKTTASPPAALDSYLNQIVPASYRSTHQIDITSGVLATIATNLATVVQANDANLGIGDITVATTLSGSDYTVRFTTTAPNYGSAYFYFSGANNDINGFIDFANSSLVSIGSKPNAGKAIIADNRFSDRSNVIGLAASDTTQSVIAAGSAIVVQKLGLISGFSSLSPGKKAYLGQLGTVVSSISSLGGLNITEIGNVKDASTVDINISTPLEGPGLGYPVGAITKLATYSFGGIAQVAADYGWLLTDGSTLDKVAYPEYTTIVDYINYINTGSTASTTAVLPNFVGYQIKVLDVGDRPVTPAALCFSTSKTKAEYDALGTAYWEVDYTNSLGTLIDYETAKLDKIVVKVFIKKASDSSITEIAPGIVGVSPNHYGYTIQDAFIDTPRKYAFRLYPATSTDGKFGFLGTDGTPYVLASGDTIIVRVYRSENFEYFVGPELTTLRKYINQDVKNTASPSFNKMTSTVATGTAPLTVASTTKVTNLNVDKLDDADLDTDVLLAANSDQKVASQKAVKSYIDNTKFLPIGTIIMFDANHAAGSSGGASGAWVDNSTMPGWYAMVAANSIYGCQDMTDRFMCGRIITGAGATFGVNSYTLGANQLPSHVHSISHSHGTTVGPTGSTDIAHSHGVTDAGHYHEIVVASTSTGWSVVMTGGGNHGANMTTVSKTTGVSVNSTTNPWNHNHGAPSVTIGGTDTANSGDVTVAHGAAIDNRPASYSVVFIRKCV